MSASGAYAPPTGCRCCYCTLNKAALEVPPPGLTTVTLTVATFETEPAVIAAVSFVALTNVVVNAPAPHFTVAPDRKPVPLTVRVKAAPPAVAELGLRLVIVGLGLMVNVTPAEVPPVVLTVTLAVPAVVMRPAGTAAVSFVALTNVVVRAVEPHSTVAPLTKFVPLIVRVKAAPPAVAELGLRLVMDTGGAELMVNVAPAEVPPVVVTVTLAVPTAAIRLAGTAAVSWLALTNVAVSAVAPHLALAPATKFVPLIVRVKAAPPAAAELGFKLVMVGGGGMMVNVDPAEVPAVVVTVTLAVPAAAIRPAGTAAVSWLALTNVVVNAVVPHLTVAPGTKFVPLTVSVKAAPPAFAELGLRLVMVDGGVLMVNVAPPEVPAVVVTVTLAVPAVAIRPAGTAAVSWLALTNDVVSAVVPHCTVAPETKFVPLIVRVKEAPPAVAELGLKLAIVGGGGLMVKVVPADVPITVVTVTLAVPGVAIRLPGTAAVSMVELKYVVAIAVPFHFTFAPEPKLVPLIVSVKAAPPTVAELGLRLVMVGGGRLTVNVAPVEVAPPGSATVTLAVPIVAIRPAGTAAVSWLALTNAVTSAAPFQFTVAPETKFVPLTVRVKSAAPAIAELGLRLEIVGTGELVVNAFRQTLALEI